MNILNAAKLMVAVVMGCSPLVGFASDEGSPVTLPSCSAPIGTLAIKPVACDARSCNHQQARPHFGPGIGAFAMKALDKKKLSVTPEAMARSKDDLSQMLKTAYSQTGCFFSVVTTEEPGQGDYTVSARIVTLDIKSKRGNQRVDLGVDIELVAGNGTGDKLTIESSSEKAAANFRDHAQMLKQSENATALDMALSDAAVQAVTETTNRMSKTSSKGMPPTASAAGVLR